jgi:arylsulfatase A-like enzyme
VITMRRRRSPHRHGILGGLLAEAALIAGMGASAAGQPAPAAAPKLRVGAEHPNLLVIMADDLGYSDIGAYGGEIDTPNLDRLASRSIRFANFYNMSRCSPSRASLLTGRYPHRVNMGENGTSLSKDVPTVAEQLRDAGYATTMVGKWHLTAATPLTSRTEQLKWLNHQAYRDRDFGERSTYPAARGFQHHWGIIWGIANYYDPFSLVNDFTPVQSVPRNFYLTDAISAHAASEVTRLGKGARPYLMYLAYTAPHWPLMAPEDLIQKYMPRFAGGWEKMRADRYARQVRLGLVDPGTNPLSPLNNDYENNAGLAWRQLTAAEKAVQVRKMATHAAMVEVMDRGIGRVVAALKASSAYENTAVMFLADNGASPEVMTYADYDRWSETRDGRPVVYGEYPAGRIGTDETMAGIGSYWASAANTPFRYWKAEAFQGGTHTPFMISWPGHMSGRENTSVATPGHVVDITPTLLALAHVRAEDAGKPVMDGISLAGALQGRSVTRAQPLFFEHEGSRAIIDGRWKLVARAPGPRTPIFRPWELYDLSRDRTEAHDLAGTRRDEVTRLAGQWDRWAREVGVRQRAEPARPGLSD